MAIFIKEGIKDISTKMTQYNPCKYQSRLWKSETNKCGVSKIAQKLCSSFRKIYTSP